MEDLDFVTKKEQKSLYDPEVALKFFRAHGRPDNARRGAPIFAEQAQGDKMYYVSEGEVTISVAGKTIDIIRKGEIFGEMSTIAGSRRTATASAKTDCELYYLPRTLFYDALTSQPGFALMMMAMMLARLRLMLTMLRKRGGLTAATPGNTSRVFDKKLLGEVAAALGQKSHHQFPKDRPIIQEGASGVFMYVVVDGSVAISINSKIVETVGQGGIFGEMALVDEGPRVASVVANRDCTLLAINREQFTQLVKTNPAFGAELLKNVSERLRYLTERAR